MPTASKALRRLAWGVGLAVCIAAALLIGGKLVLEARAHEAARAFARAAGAEGSARDKAVAVAAAVHRAYEATDQSATPPLLFRLRPYLTHALMPDFVRVEAGAIEALLIEGVCDSATRATIYVLRALGIEAVQLNIIGRDGAAHTVVRAFDDAGRPFLVDPLYGLAPMRDGRILDSAAAQRLQRGGVPAPTVWRSIAGEERSHPIYRTFADAWVSPQGASLTWAVEIDLGGADRLAIGAPDGSPDDVTDEGGRHGLSAYWHYLGHRYDRGWTRVMRFAQPTRVSFFLTEPARPGVVTTRKAPDEIAGTVVRYEVGAGESLRFRDGAARRDWLTFRSYVGVDSIVFERLPAPK